MYEIYARTEDDAKWMAEDWSERNQPNHTVEWKIHTSSDMNEAFLTYKARREFKTSVVLFQTGPFSYTAWRNKHGQSGPVNCVPKYMNEVCSEYRGMLYVDRNQSAYLLTNIIPKDNVWVERVRRNFYVVYKLLDYQAGGPRRQLLIDEGSFWENFTRTRLEDYIKSPIWDREKLAVAVLEEHRRYDNELSNNVLKWAESRAREYVGLYGTSGHARKRAEGIFREEIERLLIEKKIVESDFSLTFNFDADLEIIYGGVLKDIVNGTFIDPDLKDDLDFGEDIDDYIKTCIRTNQDPTDFKFSLGTTGAPKTPRIRVPTIIL